jgi:hypothetical protein
MYSGLIYCIVSKDGKKYYGKTIQPFKIRIKQHLNEKRNCKISNALKKYGKDEFTYNIIEKYEFISREELIDRLNQREIYWIDKDQTQKNGYNMTPGGDRGSDTRGMVKVIDPNSGQKYFVSTKDSRYISGQLISAMKGFLSVKDLDGIRYRIKIDDPEYLKGVLVSVNKGIGKVSGMKDKKMSEEAKEEIRKKREGTKLSDITKYNISKSNLNHKRMSGEKNSHYGKKWILNPSKTQRILIEKDKAEEYIALGWVFGRKIINK